MRKRTLAAVALTMLIPGSWAVGQATQPADDAAMVYMHAARIVTDSSKAGIDSPASSNFVFDEYPPFPAQWQELEKAAFTANAEARSLAHSARSIDHADWPPITPDPSFMYLNSMRALSNELADAALWQHVNGDDTAAIETLRDHYHLSELVATNPSGKKVVCLLVSLGMTAQATERLSVIIAGATITSDPVDQKHLQVKTAREVITFLLGHPDAKSIADDYIQADIKGKALPAPPAGMKNFNDERFIELVRRCHAERDLAAMSLACHLFKFDKGTWPTSLDELQNYIPKIPADPWSDGKQTLGYVLSRHGLPDGADRPLVYSRERSNGDLFIRKLVPGYDYYNGNGGQFRDVTAWVPTDPRAEAATQPFVQAK